MTRTSPWKGFGLENCQHFLLIKYIRVQKAAEKNSWSREVREKQGEELPWNHWKSTEWEHCLAKVTTAGSQKEKQILVKFHWFFVVFHCFFLQLANSYWGYKRARCFLVKLKMRVITVTVSSVFSLCWVFPNTSTKEALHYPSVTFFFMMEWASQGQITR